jgi:hypothetical protein
MSSIDQSLITLKSPRDIQTDLHMVETRLSVFAEITPPEPSIFTGAIHPDGTLLLGNAEDGSHLLLDLYDSSTGPLLVAGDAGCGKTAFLQSLVQESILLDPGEIQFGVLTPFPEEWRAQEAMPNCMGIWPTYHSSAQTFLSRLISWAEVLSSVRQVVVVLIDDLEILTARSSSINKNLRWLLSNGPQRRIWPVVSVNPGRLNRLIYWLEYFQTRILGKVQLFQTAQFLAGDHFMDLTALLPGRQFYLSQPHTSQKIWLPSVDIECVP